MFCRRVPEMLSNLQGAYDSAHWQTVVLELTPDKGILTRGTGKLDATTTGNEAQAFGVLLDASVDTAAKFSDGTVTGSVAKAGSFRGQALIVGVGTNVQTLVDALRKNNINVEGPITVPVAAMEAEPGVVPPQEPAAA